MNIINKNKGRIIKHGDFFYLEKNYDNFKDLLKEESILIDKIEDNNFIYLESTVSLCENPYYKLDKLYKRKTSKLKYRNTFKLMHTGF
tara:strand:+ start:231 stop:494 length:264 start_codon:yes stop_codon:yes gene_type:complete